MKVVGAVVNPDFRRAAAARCTGYVSSVLHINDGRGLEARPVAEWRRQAPLAVGKDLVDCRHVAQVETRGAMAAYAGRQGLVDHAVMLTANNGALFAQLGVPDGRRSERADE